MEGLIRMRSVYTIKPVWTIALFVILDIISAGMGMGVPIFCILLGLPVGWYCAMRITATATEARLILTKIVQYAAVTSVFTLILMLVIWSQAIGMLFDPAADLVNFGIPQILYEPMASFVGWLALMIVISPFLQFLMALFGAHLAWLWKLRLSQ
jgi:hypothetical protein